mmetsp:Transcript_4295/g.12004  ORF Transcript_4295/g.12004 Transcript_4295/m.12004 type:complete len:245 (+) Transcript_4295:56-790(+)
MAAGWVTLFVGKLKPESTKADLEDLFQGYPGYCGSRVRIDKRDRAVGFVDFETEAQARMALTERNNYTQHRCSDCLEVTFARNPTTNQRKRPRMEDPHHGDPAMYQGGPPLDHPPPYGMPPPFRDEFHPDHYAPPHPAIPPGPAGPPLPYQANNTLFIEGVPDDATEREMSHIFRPFHGYQAIRKTSRRGGDPGGYLCFVEFLTPEAAFAAMNALQGYKMDYDDQVGLRISFAHGDRDRGRRRP